MFDAIVHDRQVIAFRWESRADADVARNAGVRHCEIDSEVVEVGEESARVVKGRAAPAPERSAARLLGTHRGDAALFELAQNGGPPAPQPAPAPRANGR